MELKNPSRLNMSTLTMYLDLEKQEGLQVDMLMYVQGSAMDRTDYVSHYSFNIVIKNDVHA
jgi:hypothetical protein